MESDIIRFIASYREPTSIYQICAELETLGENGADWPRATCENWKRTITKLVDENKLTMDSSGCVWIVANSDKPKQMELF